MTPVSRYQPVVYRNNEGLCTIDWGTPNGELPSDGCIAVSPELIVEFIQTHNALVTAERLLGLGPHCG